VTLTSEQRTRIQQTVLAGRNVPRVDNVNFSLSVGTAVPSKVRVVETPRALIEIYPQWRGHQYFVVRDEIVIVDRSRKIVGVVPVGSSGGGAARLDSTRGAAPSQGNVAVLNLGQDEIRQVQIVLKEKGFFTGEPDGVLGPRTTQALIAFQRQQGFEASGRIDSRTVTALGMSNLSGQQGNQGGSSPSTTGQGGDATQQPAAQDRGAGQQGSQGGNQPSTTGQGGDRMQQQPANQDSGAGQQGRQGANQPSTTGQGGDRIQPPPAGRDTGGQSGTRETPQDSSPNKESR
jgi:peptidoglycan hydrolase-like protein with peptidoglycan-binding domain